MNKLDKAIREYKANRKPKRILLGMYIDLGTKINLIADVLDEVIEILEDKKDRTEKVEE